MKNNILPVLAEDLIKDAFCISINEGRRDRFSYIFKKMFGVVPRFFTGYTDNASPRVNCNIGHSAIIKTAKAMGLPYVTIFEDDAYPRPDSKVLLEHCMQHIPGDAAMAIWGYGRAPDSLKKADDFVRQVDRPDFLWGSHAYTIFSSAYDKYEELYPRPADQYWGLVGPTYLTLNCFIQYSGNSTPRCPGFCDLYHLVGEDISDEKWYPGANTQPANVDASTCNPKVYTLSGVSHENCLKDLISKINSVDINIVEVGAYAGEISKVLCSTPRVAAVWGVDYWGLHDDASDGMQDSTFEEVERRFDRQIDMSDGKLHKFKGPLSEFFSKYKGPGIDLIYLDGDHSYDKVSEQINLAISNNIPYIAGHDYSRYFPGVTKAVDEAKKSFSKFKLFSDSSWLLTNSK